MPDDYYPECKACGDSDDVGDAPGDYYWCEDCRHYIDSDGDCVLEDCTNCQVNIPECRQCEDADDVFDPGGDYWWCKWCKHEIDEDGDCVSVLNDEPCITCDPEEEESGERKDDPFENVIALIENWLTETGPKLEELFSNHKDVLHDLEEMVKTAKIGAFRACLAMAGRVLEQVLNHMMTKHKLELGEQMSVGKKIKLLSREREYIDQGVLDCSNLINHQRIIGVHAINNIEIPSEDNAAMVMFGIKDLVNRAINF